MKKITVTATVKDFKAAFYTWGEFKNLEDCTNADFNGMEELYGNDLLSFSIRKEDKRKVFIAHPDYIDRGADGTSIKYAYAIKAEVKTEWK